MGETSQASPVAGTTALLCPHCGYDLRAASNDICPECGQTIDRFTLAQSAFPWAHRRYIGRVRAFCKTVWQITIDSRRLRNEAQKPQKLSDARSFRRIVAICLGMALLFIFIAAAIDQKSLSFLAIQKSEHYQARYPRSLFDAFVPWSAGATIPPVLPVLLIILGFALCRAPRALFHWSKEDSAAALACYSIAPFTWILPITFVQLLLLYLNEKNLLEISLPVNLLMIALPSIALLATIVRICQWSYRIRKSRIRLVLAPFQLLILWLLTILLWVGLVPWCIGFAWIVIDSFR